MGPELGLRQSHISTHGKEKGLKPRYTMCSRQSQQHIHTHTLPNPPREPNARSSKEASGQSFVGPQPPTLPPSPANPGSRPGSSRALTCHQCPHARAHVVTDTSDTAEAERISDVHRQEGPLWQASGGKDHGSWQCQRKIRILSGRAAMECSRGSDRPRVPREWWPPGQAKAEEGGCCWTTATKGRDPQASGSECRCPGVPVLPSPLR